jgi:hypothetical protein
MIGVCPVFADLILGVAALHQADLLEEVRIDALARELPATRSSARTMLARWLHSLATRLDGQAVMFQVLNESVAAAEHAHR